MLIRCWLIDPKGNIYQRDARGENIITLTCLIEVFKEGRPKGSQDIEVTETPRIKTSEKSVKFAFPISYEHFFKV